MPLAPDLPFPKTQGDNVRSKDWNDAISEVIRLDNAKVNRAGDRITGALTIDGDTAIGTTGPKRRLHVEPSGLHVGGNAAALSFSNRESAFVEAPAAGERWQWYASGGIARLASGSDKLTVNTAGNVGIGVANATEPLEVNGRTKSGNLTSGPWPSNPVYCFVGASSLDHTNQINYALLQGTTGAGGDQGRTFLNSPVGIELRIGNVTKLSLNASGRLSSPMWSLNQVMNARQGPLPLTSAQFVTGGGALLIIASGTGFTNVGGNIGMGILIDGGSIGTARSFSNEVTSHRAFAMNPLVQRNIAAGTHTITLNANINTLTDANDWFFVTVLELPI